MFILMFRLSKDAEQCTIGNGTSHDEVLPMDVDEQLMQVDSTSNVRATEEEAEQVNEFNI